MPVHIHEFAPAKINLSLQVGPCQPDGYHPIDSLVGFADLGDDLSFEPAANLTLHNKGPYGHKVPVGEANLVLRSAQLLAKETNSLQSGGRITLNKVLPVASGIGGGSADAAATLRGLNRLWKLGLSVSELAEIGAKLGADIPACVHSCWLQMQGRGEQIKLLASQPVRFGVLVNPGVAVSTSAVFSRYDHRISDGSEHAYTNALTLAAIDLAPVISQVLASLQALNPTTPAQMCGSGATCLASFKDIETAKNAAITLSHANPDWWIYPIIIGEN